MCAWMVRRERLLQHMCDLGECLGNAGRVEDRKICCHAFHHVATRLRRQLGQQLEKRREQHTRHGTQMLQKASTIVLIHTKLTQKLHRGHLRRDDRLRALYQQLQTL